MTSQNSQSFPSTLGDLDLHLWAEQKHERIWDKFGAHARDLEGVRGVSFVVWAPNAASVSVVGDFNRWDGRLDKMRMLGGSGVWEVFVPDLAPATRYIIRDSHKREGGCCIKSDPFAFAAECPPAYGLEGLSVQPRIQ